LVVDARQLLKLSVTQLEALYRTSPAGEIPRGEGKGTVLFAPGTRIGEAMARFFTRTTWQGKVFDPERGELLNEVTPFGVRAIRAKVYQGPSRADGKECIVLDYSKTSLIARWVRDEIRLVAPGLYLGVAYVGPLKVVHFALSFLPGRHAERPLR
jgi:hypothetical protein